VNERSTPAVPEPTFAWVELRGQLSNPSTKQGLDLAADVLDHDQAPSAYHAALSHPASRIRDVVDVDELVLQFTHGVMIKELARELAISESSVKRLLRTQGARRHP